MVNFSAIVLLHVRYRKKVYWEYLLLLIDVNNIKIGCLLVCRGYTSIYYQKIIMTKKATVIVELNSFT